MFDLPDFYRLKRMEDRQIRDAKKLDAILEYIAPDPRLVDTLESIQASLSNINHRIKNMSAEIDRLTASVTALTTVDDSLVALVGNLAQMLRDAATDPAAVNALADKLDAEASKVSEAVTANTPAATP